MELIFGFFLLILSVYHVNGIGLLMDPGFLQTKRERRERDKRVTLPGNRTNQCSIPILSQTMIYGLAHLFIMSQ